MGNNIIHNIEFNDFKEHLYTFSNMVDYVDDNVVIASGIKDVFDSFSVVRFNFWVMIFCMEGTMQVELGNNTFTMHKDDLLMCMPLNIMGNVSFSGDNKLRVFGFSPSLLAGVMKGTTVNLDRVIAYFYDTPLFHNVQGSIPLIFKKYNEIIAMKLQDNTGYFRKQIMYYMFSALFCEMMSLVQEAVSSREETHTDQKRANLVAKRFIAEVAKDDGSHRSVGYYADLLCYSPKYVSYVVKQVSGYTAMYWINKHAMEQIKFNLRHSDRSIKEIAMMFNFPNMSFFGKYVKRYLGVSPKAYRNMIDENSTFVDTKTEKGDTAESGK